MGMSSDVVVLLDGSKTFWKTRTYLKIIIVQHVNTKCLEVISFDPAVGIEYPRIYMDIALIISKLDPNIMEETYAQKKEALNRQKISKKKEELMDEIMLNMIKQYAYARVNLVTDLPDGRTEVNLLPSFDDILVEGDKGDKRIDVERLKPIELLPYEQKIVIVKSKVEEFKAMHEDLNKEVSLANQELDHATRLISAALQAFLAAFRKHVRRLSISSNPRKRWILAINRILVKNYVLAVRKRLLKSAQFKEFSGLTLLPDGTFLDKNLNAVASYSSNNRSHSNNNVTKTLGGRKISGGLKGSFDDSLIIENFNRVFNDKNNNEQQHFARNNINNSSNTNCYENLRLQFNKSKTTGNLDYHTVSAQDTVDELATNKQMTANGFISRNIDFTNNINSRQCNNGDGDCANTTSETTADDGIQGVSQKMLGPQRTSGGMHGSFDDSDLYFFRHHNINFNMDSLNAEITTTTAATGEEQEEEKLPPITGVQNKNSLQTAIGMKIFRNDFQKTQPVEMHRVYGANIKSATDSGVVIDFNNNKTSIDNNSNSNNNSNYSSSNSSNNSNENSISIRNKDNKSTRIGHNTAGHSDISPFGSPKATPRNSNSSGNNINNNVTFSVDNSLCGTPRLAPIGEQSTLYSNCGGNSTNNNSSSNELSPQASASLLERNNDKSARKAYNLQPIFNKNTASWENRAGDVINLSAQARMEKESSFRRTIVRDEERSIRRNIPLHNNNNSHHSGTNSMENSFRKPALSRENSYSGIGSGGAGNVSHDNHIHGLKLVKQVGSFRLSNSPKSMTNLFTAQSADKHIGSSSTSNLHNTSSDNTGSSNSISPNSPNSGGHLAQMRSLRKSNSSNSTGINTNTNNIDNSVGNNSFVNGLNSALNSAFNSQCNSQSNTAQNSVHNSARNSLTTSISNSLNNSCENLVGLLTLEVENVVTAGGFVA